MIEQCFPDRKELEILLGNIESMEMAQFKKIPGSTVNDVKSETPTE